MGYGKLFASCYTGSMIGAGPDVFAVWGYVVAHTIKCQVELNPPLLAFTLGCTVERVEAAIAKLCDPDPKSRNKDEGGRRMIKEGEFAYRVVSHDLYRQMQDEDERREYMRQYMRERREKQGGKPRKHSSTEVTQAEAVSRSSIQEAEAAPPTPSAATPPSPKPEEQEITNQAPPRKPAAKTIFDVIGDKVAWRVKDEDRTRENAAELEAISKAATPKEVREAIMAFNARLGRRPWSNELMPEIVTLRAKAERDRQAAPGLAAKVRARQLMRDHQGTDCPALMRAAGIPIADAAQLETAAEQNPELIATLEKLLRAKP